MGIAANVDRDYGASDGIDEAEESRRTSRQKKPLEKKQHESREEAGVRGKEGGGKPRSARGSEEPND